MHAKRVCEDYAAYPANICGSCRIVFRTSYRLYRRRCCDDNAVRCFRSGLSSLFSTLIPNMLAVAPCNFHQAKEQTLLYLPTNYYSVEKILKKNGTRFTDKNIDPNRPMSSAASVSPFIYRAVSSVAASRIPICFSKNIYFF